MKHGFLRKMLLICLAACLVLMLSACQMPEILKKLIDRMDGPSPESAGKGEMAGNAENSFMGDLDHSQDGGSISFGGDGEGSLIISGGDYIGVNGNGTVVIDGEEYTVRDGCIYAPDGSLMGQLETSDQVVEVPVDKEEDPYAGKVGLPTGDWVDESQIITAEDGTRWAKLGEEYYGLHPDGTFSNVFFLNESMELVSLSEADSIVHFIYEAQQDGWVVHKHTEYSAADRSPLFEKKYKLERMDGRLCYISAETTVYFDGVGHVSTRYEYDPQLGAEFPIKTYRFTADGRPDGHSEHEYYPDGAPKEARQYHPGGECQYIYRYNEAGIMVEETWFRTDGSTESVNYYDENGAFISATYYREDGSYYTVEAIENGNRYTFYDAGGNVTESYDEIV